MLASSSISYAAEGTLPGDILYPVKIHINENIYNVMAFSHEAQASWHTERAERRFEEIEQLLAKNELDEEKAIIAQIHLEEALKAAEISSDPIKFSAILDIHSAVLAKIDRNHLLENTQMNTSISETRKIITKRKHQKYAPKGDQTDEILLIPTLESASEKKIIAKERFDLINAKLNDIQLDRETRRQVEAKTKLSTAAYDRGSAALEAGNYVTARDQFIESMMFMQEAKLVASVPKLIGLEDVLTSTSTPHIQPKKSSNEADVEELRDSLQESVNDLLPS
jgi:Domain of unknown function (DUF5667)